MKTKLHTYRFDISNPSEKEAYKKLCEELRSTPGRGHWMNCISVNGYNYKAGDVELEENCLFENQWNCEQGRVFDWFEEYQIHNKKIKRGHYLDITPEMAEIRANTCKCGYCGKMEYKAFGKIHEGCFSSPYLKEEEIYLCRMMPVDFKGKRLPLSDEEKEIIIPKYIDAQTKGNDERSLARLAKMREDLKKDLDSTIANAKTKFDGMTWLMDNGVNIENVIYYSHTNTFSFGWRSPLSESVKSRILDIISEFPFEYEFHKNS